MSRIPRENGNYAFFPPRLCVLCVLRVKELATNPFLNPSHRRPIALDTVCNGQSIGFFDAEDAEAAETAEDFTSNTCIVCPEIALQLIRVPSTMQ